MGVVVSILASVGMIALAIVLARAAWQVFLVLASKSIDGVRDRGQVDQVCMNYNRLLDSIEQERRRKETEQKTLFTDLNGQPVYLTLVEQGLFRRECLMCMGLAPVERPTKKQVRSHWRKNVIRWHPDQGGDGQQWLVRLRAYEALMAMEEAA
jgi:hypothetical protein